MPWWSILLLAIAGFLVAVAIYDVLQKRHAILHNFPVIGHLRYITELFGPELRQYIVADNDEERPFSRDQRRWVYATSKLENPYFGFGTDNDVEAPGQIIIGHSAFPVLGGDHRDPLPAAKVLGGWRQRPGAFRPASVVNISGMSFGSLSGPAVRALNEGARHGGCLHNTGEGGISDHHRHGGELVYQIGTGYFGCRDEAGRFSMDRLLETVAGAPVRAIELKLSQGAKPGIGGLLPAAKVTPEIAAARGVPVGVAVQSPARHRAFDDVAGLVQLVERIADATGLPVGIKSAVGQPGFWAELADHMADTGRGPDFVTIDGGEGGTGAGPAVFTDHVAYAFRQAMAKAYAPFVGAGLHQRVVFIGAGKLGYPETALAAFTLGCDMVNVGREAMLAIGCVQAQRCHTGHCPTGVATQNRWLTRGLDPTSKGVRAGNYVTALRRELLRLAHAAGVVHPALVPATAVEIVTENGATVPVADHYGLGTDIERLGGADTGALVGLMGEVAGA